MTTQELSRTVGRILFLPLGAIEQHGPHLPLETDIFTAEKLAERLAERHDGLVAPGFTYGCSSLPMSGGGDLFQGTVSLSAQTFMAMIADLVSSYVRHGHLRIVLVNGHMENSMFAIEGAKQGIARVADARVVVIDWWNILSDDQLRKVFGTEFPGWEADHAGVSETSLMLHLAPEHVRAELLEDRVAEIRPPNYTTLPERPGLVDPSGVLRTAMGSTAAIGSSLFSAIADSASRVIVREFETSM